MSFLRLASVGATTSDSTNNPWTSSKCSRQVQDDCILAKYAKSSAHNDLLVCELQQLRRWVMMVMLVTVMMSMRISIMVLIVLMSMVG